MRGAVTSLLLAMTVTGVSILTLWTLAGGNLGLLVTFLLVNGACTGALISLQPTVNASLFSVGEMGVVSRAEATRRRSFADHYLFSRSRR